MNYDLHQLILMGLSTGVFAKVVIMAARTMPPPLPNCGFWRRWAFDFIQQVCENQDRLKVVQGPISHAPENPIKEKA